MKKRHIGNCTPSGACHGPSLPKHDTGIFGPLDLARGMDTLPTPEDSLVNRYRGETARGTEICTRKTPCPGRDARHKS